MTSAQLSVQASRQALPAFVISKSQAYTGTIPSAVVAMPGAADVLQRIGHILQVSRGRTVVEVGDANENVFKVTDGILRVVRILPDGRRHIASFLKPGDFYGFSETVEHEDSIEAVTDCILTRYSRREFEAVLDSDAAAGRQLFRLLCRQLGASSRMLLLLGRKTAPERLASFLMSFGGAIPAAADGYRQVYLPMSRSDIADHLGLTIETVSRLITKFRKARWIKLLDAHTVLITAPEALEDLAAD